MCFYTDKQKERIVSMQSEIYTHSHECNQGMTSVPQDIDSIHAAISSSWMNAKFPYSLDNYSMVTIISHN